MKSKKSKFVAVLAVVAFAIAAYGLGASGLLEPHPASANAVLYNEDTVTSIYTAASPAIMEIQVAKSANNMFGMSGEGTGFLVDNQGHLLTNNHVVSGMTSIKVVLPGGKTADAKVVGTAPTYDLALVSIDPALVSGIKPLAMADSSQVKPGQMAIAIGNPFGLEDTITVGVISGLNRSIGTLTGMIQTDAAVNPGNSGGPLLNAQLQVVGIVTAMETQSGAHNIGFAIPSNVATQLLPDLVAGKTVSKPWLGISGLALTTDQAKQLGLSVNSGVYVAAVIPNSPAEKAGLKGNATSGGDVITAIDGKAVSSVPDIQNYLAGKRVGDTVKLTVNRGGSNSDIQVTLGAWPDQINQSQPQIPQQQPMPRQSIPGERSPYGNGNRGGKSN